MLSEWVSDMSDLDPAPSPECTGWMKVSGNLGGALRCVYPSLYLRLLGQRFDRPFDHEAKALRITQKNSGDKPCFIRHIFLEENDVPLTFGRVVVPQNVYGQFTDAFTSLGTQLIGEALLYRQATTIRGPFEFKNIGIFDPTYRLLQKNLPIDYPFPAFFPARRSIFFLNGEHPLLIMEIFLDGLKAQSQ